MNKATFYQNLEEYIDELLSEDEMKEYRTFLIENPDMNKEVDLHNKIRSTIKHVGREELRLELNDIRDQVKRSSTTQGAKVIPTAQGTMKMRYIIGIAATLLILVMGYLISLNNQKDSTLDFVLVEQANLTVLPGEGKFGGKTEILINATILLSQGNESFQYDEKEIKISLNKEHFDDLNKANDSLDQNDLAQNLQLTLQGDLLKYQIGNIKGQLYR